MKKISKQTRINTDNSAKQHLETWHFLLLQRYVPLRSVFNFMFGEHFACDLVSLRHKKILVRDRKRSYFRLPGSVGANMAEKCPPCHVKVSGLVATDKAGKCPDVSWKRSNGFAHTNVQNIQSFYAYKSWYAILNSSVLLGGCPPPPYPLPLVLKVSSYMLCECVYLETFTRYVWHIQRIRGLQKYKMPIFYSDDWINIPLDLISSVISRMYCIVSTPGTFLLNLLSSCRVGN